MPYRRGRRPLLTAGLMALMVAAACGSPTDDRAAPAPGAPAPATGDATPAAPLDAARSGTDAASGGAGAALGAAVSGARPGGSSTPPGSSAASAPNAPSAPATPSAPNQRTAAAPDTRSSGAESTPRPPGVPGPEAPTSPPPAGEPGGPRSEVVLGSVGTISGLAGEILAGYVRGAQVWVRSVNDRGGVNGHKVRLVVGDDGGDPARHVALLQQFKERDRAVAFIAKAEPFAGPAVNEWHRKNRMPVIGPDPGAQYAYRNPMYFLTSSVGDGQFAGALSALAAVAIPKGRTKLAIIKCSESEACANMDRVWAGQAKALGFEVVYRAQASIAQPDFTAECLGARNAGAQVVGLALDINSVGRFTTACRRQEYKPDIGSVAVILVAGSAKQPALEGSVWGATTWAWFAGDTPSRREFLDAMARYQAGAEPLPFNALGWLAGKVFEYAARQLPEPPTSEAVLDGLYTVEDNDFGGLTYPLTYRRDQPVMPRSCGTTVVIRDGKYTAPFGVDLTCAD